MLPILLGSPTANVIAQSVCGSGKTVAFAVAMLSRVDESCSYPQVLCISPNFEVAIQTASIVRSMGIFMDLKVGCAIDKATGSFDDCQIIIGTPKEITCLRISGIFDLKKIKMVVCDDADVIATTHLVRSHLLDQLPANCQQILSSATPTHSSTIHVVDAVMVKVSRAELISPNMEQYYIECNSTHEKLYCLREILKQLTRQFRSEGQIIVFCNVSSFKFQWFQKQFDFQIR